MPKTKSTQQKGLKREEMATCRYCKGKYKKIKVNQRFCSEEHRKKFWAYGALPLAKAASGFAKEIERICGETYQKEIAALCEAAVTEVRNEQKALSERIGAAELLLRELREIYQALAIRAQRFDALLRGRRRLKRKRYGSARY